MAKVSVYPLDLTKKRLQVQGFEDARKHFGKVTSCDKTLYVMKRRVEIDREVLGTDFRAVFFQVRKYDGLMHCLKLTLAEEGVRGLYKGFTPSLLKAIVTSGLMFGFYEEILRIIRETQ